jgi:hypothetical protein
MTSVLEEREERREKRKKDTGTLYNRGLGSDPKKLGCIQSHHQKPQKTKKQEERQEKHDKPLQRGYETISSPHSQCLGAPPIRSILLIILLLEAIPEGRGIPLPILLCTGAEATGGSLNAGMAA